MSEITQNPNYCCICLTVQENVKTHCQSGIMCVDCIKKYNKDECPICREETEKFLIFNEYKTDLNNEILRTEYNWINSYYRFNAIKIMIMQILMPIVSFYVVSVIGYMIVNYFNFNEKNFGIIGISGLGLIPCLIAKSIYDFLTRPRPPALALIARNRRIFFNRRLRGAYYHPNIFINNMNPIAEHIIVRNRHRNT
jgi:hypothetical protein